MPTVQKQSKSFFKHSAVALLLLMVGSAIVVKGDVVETADGRKVSGTLQTVSDDVLAITPTAKADAAERVEITNVFRVTVDPYIDRRQQAALLIDNDGAKVGRTLSGRKKLRAGLHRIAIPYWHESGNAMLRMQFSGPKQSLRIIPASMFVHLPEGASETRSPGDDAEGFRLPEKATATNPGLVYTMHSPTGATEEGTVRNFVNSKVLPQPATPVMDRVGPEPISERTGLVLSGYLKVDRDGEYNFLLTSDGGSQLYLGPAPRPFRTIALHRGKHPWSLEFVTGEKVEGRLVSWDANSLGFELSVVDGPLLLTIPHAFVRSVQQSAAGAAAPGDSTEFLVTQPDADTVFAKTSGNKVQPVAGRVVEIDGNFLIFRYEEEDRRIHLDRVVHISLPSPEAELPGAAKYHHALSLFGESAVPGFLKSLEGTAILYEALWGETLKFSIDDVTDLTVRNGRLVFLSDLEPAVVEQVPFFDRIVPYRVDQSLSGGPLQLRDGKHEKGISVHARTVLHYNLAGKFRKFLGVVGFEHPAGQLGRTVIRVSGDDRVLFENPDFKGTDEPQKLEIDVSGVQRLSLLVDFGENQDVCDRVIWADARLLRDDVER